MGRAAYGQICHNHNFVDIDLCPDGYCQEASLADRIPRAVRLVSVPKSDTFTTVNVPVNPSTQTSCELLSSIIPRGV